MERKEKTCEGGSTKLTVTCMDLTESAITEQLKTATSE